MDPQEITEELEHPGARNLLDSATLLRLAYNGPDGFPRVIPIGFYWNGNQIVVCTAATAPKVKALSSRPNVAMTIDVGDHAYGGEGAPGISIEPVWARFFDFGAGRMPYFLTKLAGDA